MVTVPMNIDQLLKTTVRYETQQVPVDHRITKTSWFTMAGVAVAAGIYHTLGRSLVDAQVNFLFQPARQLTTFAGHPQTGVHIAISLLVTGLLLGVLTRGATRANQNQHHMITTQILVSTLVAAPAILGLALYALASIVWLTLTIIIVAMVIMVVIAILAN